MLTTHESIESLTARQMEMEDHALAMGGKRFRDRLEGAIKNGTEAQVGAAKKLLTEGLERVEVALQAMLDEQRRGRRHMAEKWVKLLGVDVASYLSLKVVLDNIHGRVSVRKAAYEVTELILDELRFRRFKEQAPKLYEYVMSSFTTSSYAHKARSLDARLHHAEVDVSDLEMGQAERLAVGVKLLDVVREVTGLVQVESKKVFEGGKNVDVVELVATEDTLKWLDERNGALEFLFPVNLPMVMPPLPWAPGRRGGYRFALRGKHRMVRSNSKGHRELIEQASMPEVYAALNRIQETPWVINHRVLEVVNAIMGRGGDLAGLPSSSDLPMPPKPHDIDTNEEARKEWRKAASGVHEANHEARVARRCLFDLLNVVNKVKDENAIWFPHNLDFRGRIYPVTNFLHPQGDDLTKSLLQFAEGKPLGRDGAAYLALHGAASLGKTLQGAKLSHMSLQERVDYIVSISQAICDVAADPIGNTWWADGDDPWQFLAFCFDWAGFCAYDAEGRGADYVSQLPVAMDGTCNGLQHFAALWLDEVGGKAVNVMPSDRPQDVYQAIADAVLDRLEKDNAEPLAQKWLTSGLVDRKLTKRPTMTFGYGSQQYGFTEQLSEYVMGLPDFRTKWKAFFSEDVVDEETGEVKTKSLVHAACAYMAKLIWESLQTVSRSAFDGMAWMRESAKLIAKEGKKCVEWRVPGTGFPVRQGYVEQKKKETATVLAGSAFRPRVYEDTPTPAWKKQTSSVAPNIVHSLDAAALMLTVNAASNEGITHFAMVHDSYGTLAADAPLLATLTRQAFHGLYTQQDVVASLRDQFTAQLQGVEVDGEPAVVPTPPSKGSMDISSVLVSDYFFS